MSRNIKEIGKELMGKSLNSFHRKTGLTQLEKNNEMQDGILDGVLSQVDDTYIDKTEQSNVIHLDGSGDGVVVLDSIEGNTMTDAILNTNMYNNKNKTFSISTRWSTVIISCRAGKLNDKIYYRIKLKVNKLETEDTRLAIASMRDNGGFNRTFALLKDIGVGNTKEVSTIRDIDVNCNNLYNSVSIGCQGELPDDCTSGVEFANFTLNDFVVVNLTEMFGSGKEPSQEWCDANIPFIEGLQSSFEEKVNDEGKYEIEILMKNRNLFNIDEFIDGWYIEQQSGSIVGNGTRSYNPNYIHVDSNVIYFKQKEQLEQMAIHCYDKNKQWLYCKTTGKGTESINELPVDTKYIRLAYAKLKSEYVNNEIYISESDGLYIPYKHNKIKLLINEPLRSVGDIKDRLCVKDSKLVVERNCKPYTLDGSGNWYLAQETFKENCYYFKTQPSSYAKDYPAMITSSNAISNRVNILPNGRGDVEGLAFSKGNGIITFEYIVQKNKFTSYENAKEEMVNNLKSNNIQLIYQLETPYYEEVTNEYGEPIILEGYENGTIYIDSTIVPTTSIRYTPKMESFKTLKEVNNNNIMLTNDVNDNIIPYMMDVDLMIMEKEMALMSQYKIRRIGAKDMTSMQKRTQDMLTRLIKGKTLTEQECKTRVVTYLDAGKITDAQADELMLLISEVYA